jgi:hypothetical protein
MFQNEKLQTVDIGSATSVCLPVCNSWKSIEQISMKYDLEALY